MRWVSVCTILGAVLLPAANARPLCNVKATTTTSITSAIETTTSIPTETPTTTPTETQTPTETPTTLVTLTRTTTTSTTPTPTVVNLIPGGDFDEDRTVWNLRTVTIEKDATKAASGEYYARYYVNDQEAIGGNNINQTINGLDVTLLYRLSFKGSMIGTPDFDTTTCVMQASNAGTVIYSWPLNGVASDGYHTYTSTDLTLPETIYFTFSLRCASNTPVSIEFDVDDIVLEAVGVAPTTTSAAPAATSTVAAP